MRRVARLVVALLALAGLAAIVAGVFLWRGGISAKRQPGALETAVAIRVRGLGIPREAQQRRNPVTPTPDVVLHQGPVLDSIGSKAASASRP